VTYILAVGPLFVTPTPVANMNFVNGDDSSM
jgi:hypothetical protein